LDDLGHSQPFITIPKGLNGERCGLRLGANIGREHMLARDQNVTEPRELDEVPEPPKVLTLVEDEVVIVIPKLQLVFGNPLLLKH
jgi:hypothetical protein